MVTSEKDAQVALQVSNALTKALTQYKLKTFLSDVRILIICVANVTNVWRILLQATHSDWKTWKMGRHFSSQGKSQGILNRLEKSGEITQDTGNFREF